MGSDDRLFEGVQADVGDESDFVIVRHEDPMLFVKSENFFDARSPDHHRMGADPRANLQKSIADGRRSEERF